MTKKEKVIEMISDLKFVDNEKTINNCVKKNTTKRIDEVYNYFHTHYWEKGISKFCIALLNK